MCDHACQDDWCSTSDVRHAWSQQRCVGCCGVCVWEEDGEALMCEVGSGGWGVWGLAVSRGPLLCGGRGGEGWELGACGAPLPGVGGGAIVWGGWGWVI